MLEKLTRGVLHVSGSSGLMYVRPRFMERVRLIWLFRNFRIQRQHVFPPHHRNWLEHLCADGRARRYSSALDREIACVIGTVVTSEPARRLPKEERRRALRVPLHFEVRYGIASESISWAATLQNNRELIRGEGCDISETGIAFAGIRVFTPGTELTVHYRFEATGRNNWVRTRAIVRNLTGNRMGAEFSIIHPRDRAELRQLTAATAQA